MTIINILKYLTLVVMLLLVSCSLFTSTYEVHNYAFARNGQIHNDTSSVQILYTEENSSNRSSYSDVVIISTDIVEVKFPSVPQLGDTVYYDSTFNKYPGRPSFKVYGTTPDIRGGYITLDTFQTEDSLFWNTIPDFYGDVKNNWEITDRMSFKYKLFWNLTDTLEESVDIFIVQTDILD